MEPGLPPGSTVWQSANSDFKLKDVQQFSRFVDRMKATSSNRGKNGPQINPYSLAE
jgi:hypothetical protein